MSSTQGGVESQEGEDRPWERPGAVRRDCEPDRGDLLLLLGTLSLACGALSCCLLVPGFLGLPLGMTVMAMAGRDLRQMEAGRMDPQGEHRTEEAEGRAFAGALFSIPGIMLGLPVLFRWLGVT